MPSGTNYVSNPGYTPVQARVAPMNENTIPSGATIVRGFYYAWSSDDTGSGFTGVSWFENVKDGPTWYFLKNHSGFETFQEYIDSTMPNPNLDSVFSEWQAYIISLDNSGGSDGAIAAGNFATQVGTGARGCVTYVNS